MPTFAVRPLAHLCGPLLLVAACAGAPPEPAVDAAFERIQVAEAAWTRAAAAVATCDPEAPCPARAELRAAVQAICAEADALRGAPARDARARCRAARRAQEAP